MAKKISEEKLNKVLAKYGLEDLNDDRDASAVYQIAKNLYGTGMMDVGVRFDLRCKPTDKMQAIYQRAMIEQNWIIIRQLDRIAKVLER